MMKLVKAAVALSAICLSAVPGLAGVPAHPSGDAALITFDLDTQQSADRSLIFGANMLYNFDGPQSLASPQLIATTREVGPTLLRYPGGEMANNFDWSTNDVEDRNRYPFEKATDVHVWENSDDFCAFLQKVGAQGLITVNVDGAFARDGGSEASIDAYAKLAADWVRHMNLGGNPACRIRYWEVGNELYWKSSRYPLTAQQYAAALVVFSKAMKAVDPSIQIGAIGPKEPDYRGDADRPVAGPRWWPTVISVAGRAFDFASVHEYIPDRLFSAEGMPSGEESDPIAKQTRDLENQLTGWLGHPIPIGLTEWNVRKAAARRATDHGNQLGIAMADTEFLMQLVQEKTVAFATFFPMRQPGFILQLIRVRDNRPTSFGQIFGMLAHDLEERIMASASSNRTITAVVSTDRSRQAVVAFLLNRSGTSIAAEMRVAGASTVREKTLTPRPGQPNLDEATQTLTPKDGVLFLQLAAYSFTEISLSRSQRY
jgi:hypothetical protein